MPGASKCGPEFVRKPSADQCWGLHKIQIRGVNVVPPRDVSLTGDRACSEVLDRDPSRGSSRLLVSHWSLDSAAATGPTTTTFENLEADPTMGRAEALGRAMLAYLNDASNPRNAYPAFGGPSRSLARARRVESCARAGPRLMTAVGT